jgi:predicted ATPase/DNA-binding SARP family transcriptional activator
LDGKPVARFESNKVRALLATLAAEAKRSQPRERLAGLLWPDWPQPSAMRNLRYALADLRKNIGDREADPPFLRISRESIQLNPESDVWVDVGEFERLSAISSQLSALSNQQPAVELYRGEFLEGFALAGSPAFEEWSLAKREHYRRQAMQALHALAEAHGQAAEWEPALAYARRQLALEPWQEEAHRQVMRFLALSGQRSAALTQYETCRRLLAKELGVQSGAETIKLYEAIRDGTLEIGQATARPEPVVLELTIPPRRKHNLPLQLTSFVGREQEIAGVQALVGKAQGRLVTLTGPGGVGKTRLALQVAASLLETFLNGVWLVELAPLSDRERLPSAVATALDVRESPGHPIAVALSDYLRAKHLLLILDNCEHLIDACAGLAVTLLQNSPGLQILATSRELLGVPGESVFSVPALSLPGDQETPDIETLSQSEAVRLFVERAQAACPGFTLAQENAGAVAQICQRLDGLPLAIELAAARTRLLSAGQIAARLNDAFRLLTGGSRTALPRHQTLQASIDWSYNLLTAQEQELLQLLSVFAGGWTIEAVEEVCKGEGWGRKDEDRDQPPYAFIISPVAVLDLLGQLVDKSLVIAAPEPGGGEIRYRMLETIRKYAWEKLEERGGADQARDRHLAYYLSLVERIEPELRGRSQKAHLDQLEEELDNLRLALGWALQTDPEAELRLAAAMMWYWHIRNQWGEGAEWLEKGLARMQTPGTPGAPHIMPVILAKARSASGLLHTMTSNERAEGELEESLKLYRALGPEGQAGVAFAQCWLGQFLVVKGELSRAIAMLREALDLSRQVHDPFRTAECLLILGATLDVYEPGSLEARRLLQEALGLLQEIDDRDGIATAYKSMGSEAFQDRELEQAKFFFKQSLLFYQQVGNKDALCLVNRFLGYIAWMQRDISAAIQYNRRIVTIQRDAGNQFMLGYTLIDMSLIYSWAEKYELAMNCLQEAWALFEETGDRWLKASCHWAQGVLAWVTEDRERAAREQVEALAAGQGVNDRELIPLIWVLKSSLARAEGDEKGAEAGLKEALRVAGTITLSLHGSAKAMDLLAQLKARTDPQRSARLFGAVDHHNWAYPYFLISKERAESEAALAQVKAALGEQRFAELWAEGQAMTSAHAISYALEEEHGKEANGT